MGTILKYPGHSRSFRSLDSEKIIGKNIAVGGLLNARGQGPRRPNEAAPEPADSGAIGLETSRSGFVIEALAGHPIGEFHGAEGASSAQCMSSTMCTPYRGRDLTSAQYAPMAPVPKPRPRRPTFLRQWRLFRGLTQEKAASRLDMDRTNLSKIERGLVPYDQALLERAAEAYQCEPADLIMRDPKSPIWELLDTVRQLPEMQQKQLSRIVEGFMAGLKEVA